MLLLVHKFQHVIWSFPDTSELFFNTIRIQMDSQEISINLRLVPITSSRNWSIVAVVSGFDQLFKIMMNARDKVFLELSTHTLRIVTHVADREASDVLHACGKGAPTWVEGRCDRKLLAEVQSTYAGL